MPDSPTKKILSNRGSIEILLLLCCLVGVVLFFCFSIGVTVVLIEPLQMKQMLEELDSLKKEKEKKAYRVGMLEKDKSGLLKLIVEKGKRLSDSEQTAKKETEEELKYLKKKYEDIIREMERIREELANLPDSSNLQENKKEKEKELERFKAALKEIEQKIEEMKNKLAGLGENKMEARKEERAKMNKELNGLEKEKDYLEERIKKAKVETIWKGAERFNNPLFVECKKTSLIIYPGKKAFTLSEIDKRNFFKDISRGYDAIVLLVRPDGFETFEKSYGKIKTLNTKLSYEPVDADASLKFLMGVKEP